jgi:eukaryotic-like serine/threonine-protein kinase
LPTIRAEVELHGANVSGAVSNLAETSAYELGDTSIPGAPALYPAYVRGLAYLRGQQGAAAAAEFQKLLTHRGLVGNHPIGALAHLGLARAYDVSGKKADATREYQTFLTLWKDADADLPVLKEARGEYARAGSARAVPAAPGH